MAGEREVVCVTGGAGYVGSWLVMTLLQQGYTVRATVRDPSNMEKVKPLLELPKAKSHLTLWKADLSDEGSFDEAIQGCKGVFHVASPVNFQPEDPEKEIIEPAVKGVLNVMKSCIKAKTVKRVVFTSSAGTLCGEEHSKPMYDETCWTDVEFCRSTKSTGWMYFVSKTISEQEAWKFAKENELNFISVQLGLVVGPFITATMPLSIAFALSPITGNEEYCCTLKQSSFIHVDCVCRSLIFLFQHPKAQGRYISATYDVTIYDVAKLLKQKYPYYNVLTKFKDCEEDVKPIHFSNKKLIDLGFEFKYGLEDMLTAAVETCQAKGFLPSPSN